MKIIKNIFYLIKNESNEFVDKVRFIITTVIFLLSTLESILAFSNTVEDEGSNPCNLQSELRFKRLNRRKGALEKDLNPPSSNHTYLSYREKEVSYRFSLFLKELEGSNLSDCVIPVDRARYDSYFLCFSGSLYLWRKCDCTSIGTNLSKEDMFSYLLNNSPQIRNN